LRGGDEYIAWNGIEKNSSLAIWVRGFEANEVVELPCFWNIIGYSSRGFLALKLGGSSSCNNCVLIDLLPPFFMMLVGGGKVGATGCRS